MSENDSKYVTIQDVADHFLVSVSTVRSWIRTKALPPEAYLQVGNTYRFKLPTVEKYLQGANSTQFEKKMEEQTALYNNPDQDI